MAVMRLLGMQRSNRGLVVPIAAGDGSRSFEDFYVAEYHLVLGVLLMVTADRQDAEDIAQDAFGRAFERWSSVAHHANPEAWVRRVALNRAVSAWRRSRTARRAGERLGTTSQVVAGDPVLSDEGVWHQVARLPRRQAQTIALRYVEDRSDAQIANILGISMGSVKTHLHRAHRALGQLLGEEN